MQDCLGISREIANSVKKLVIESGIYALPNKKKGSNTLSENEKQKIINYYCDETNGNSKVLAGKKDCISIGNKQYKQKQLLLLTLRELYALYTVEHPERKISLSTFSSLRPKWCVLPGSSGTHSICVCKIHQNVELQLFALNSKYSLNNIISKIVCNSKNEKCMLRTCLECSEKDVKEIVKNLIFEVTGEDESIEDDDLIELKQWITADRADLITQIISKSELLDLLSDSLIKLIPHDFVTKEQYRHLRNLKENLTEKECIVLMDFSENYNFIVQDQAQAYYWTKNSCTVHPVIIYFKNNGDLKHQCFCYLSDDLKHDVQIVHIFQNKIVNYIKENIPNVQKINYFSDGCPGQYKNCYNLLHLCRHTKLYSIDATWTFFATSHGKTENDGVGATVKREATKESLRRRRQNQITDIDKLLEFCKAHIKNIHCEIIRKAEVDEYRNRNKTEKVFTIPGTRNLHEFVPYSEHIIQCKTISTQEHCSLVFDLINNKKIK